MEYTKLPTDFTQQLDTLRQRGMYIPDEREAIKQLDSISYFRLANYWKPLVSDQETRLFMPGSNFEEVISLYQFDKKLRSLIFTAIQDVEIALRTRIIHHFSLRYGSFWFMERHLFHDGEIYDICLSNLRNELRRSREDFIQEHFEKYDSPDCPPAWKTLEVASFGTLSKLYCNMKDPEVKKLVARDFQLPQYLYLESWIKSGSVLRNCCAHHARLWNRRFPIIPRFPRRLPLPWISTDRMRPMKLYAHLCYIANLDQTITPNSSFREELVNLIAEKPGCILHSMGFPDNWRIQQLWAN